jgi:hypothetical protein
MLLSSCPEQNREWLAGILEFGNEISLRKRVKRIMKPFQPFLGTRSERKKLIGNVVDTRNYLTHFDKELEQKAARRRDLWVLCMKLEAIYQLHFLKKIGFTDEQIAALTDRSNSLNKKLKLSFETEDND